MQDKKQLLLYLHIYIFYSSITIIILNVAMSVSIDNVNEKDIWFHLIVLDIEFNSTYIYTHI